MVIDLTKETRLLVDLVCSLKANYGATKLILALMGSGSKKLSNELQNSPYFGAGKSQSSEWWKPFIEMLVQHNYLKYILYANKFQLVAIGSKSIKDTVMLPVSEEMQLLGVDQTYLSRLRQARTEIAHQDKVAPYMVVSDTVLLDIAQNKPTTMASLQNINGVTKIMVEKHGDKFLYGSIGANPKPDSTKPKSESDSAPTRRWLKNSTLSTKESLRLAQAGLSPEEIAKQRGLKSNTIEDHLATEWALEPSEIDEQYVGLTQEIYDAVSDAIQTVGQDKLKPIKDAVSENITYFQIKVCLIMYNEANP